MPQFIRQAADAGRLSGRTSRQSNPSNKAANIAGDIRITPSRSCGQTNLQPSSRLCTSTSPVRSQTKILIRSAPFGAEHKGGAAVRIKAKHLLHRRGEPVETATEVDRSGRHVDLQIGARRNHRDARTARITPDNCSTSTSVRITTSPITISTFAGAGLPSSA